MATRPRILVGLSGGLDSTVTVRLLQEQGYAPEGITLVLQANDPDHPLPAEACGYDTAVKAAAAAADLGIPHRVIDARDRFTQSVLRACWDVFEAGGTPNPCVFCNARIRFGMMVALARENGIDQIATGHYARLVPAPDGRFRLLRGIDPDKDQSYFLHGVDPALYPHILFPLGGMRKREVRERARQWGFKNAEAPESQDVCFAGPDGHFAEQLRLRFGGRATPGVFVDETGKVLGTHSGIHRYTLGQRKGLGFATGQRVKICRIDTATGAITVSPDSSATLAQSAHSDDFRWIASPPSGTPLLAQVRYRQKAVPATLTRSEGPHVTVTFAEPVFSVTPGQSLVLYAADEVIGGGTISLEG